MSTKIDQDPPPTTFKDVIAAPRCPDCGEAPKTSKDGALTCSNGHTWTPTERNVRL